MSIIKTNTIRKSFRSANANIFTSFFEGSGAFKLPLNLENFKWTSEAWAGSRCAKVSKVENNYLINFGEFLAFLDKNMGLSGSQREKTVHRVQFNMAQRFTPRVLVFLEDISMCSKISSIKLTNWETNIY